MGWVENERSLRITIQPSFWETAWAMAIYILAFLLILFSGVYILFTIYRLKHEVSVEQQVSDIKLRFLSNISSRTSHSADIDCRSCGICSEKQDFAG